MRKSKSWVNSKESQKVNRRRPRSYRNETLTEIGRTFRQEKEDFDKECKAAAKRKWTWYEGGLGCLDCNMAHERNKN